MYTRVPSFGRSVSLVSRSNDCVGSSRKSNFCKSLAITITPSSFNSKFLPKNKNLANTKKSFLNIHIPEQNFDQYNFVVPN